MTIYKRREILWVIFLSAIFGSISGLFPAAGVMLISLFILGFSFFLMQKSTRFFQYFTIPGVFFIFYLAFIYGGSPYVYLAHPGLPAIKYIIAVHLVLLLIPLGIIISNHFLKFKPIKELTFYSQKPLKDNLKDSIFIAPFFLIVLFAVGLLVVYLFQLKTIPFLGLLSGTKSYTELTELRYSATRAFMGSSYLYNLSYTVLLPLLSLLALAKYFASKKKIWLTNFIILFFITTFGTLATNQKAPIAMYLIALFILYTINRGKINYKKSLLLAITLLLILLPVVYLLNPDIPAGKERALRCLQAISRRIFLGQSKDLYSYFKIFPEIHPFVYGRTIGDLSEILGWECFPASQYVYDKIFPQYAGTGSCNTAFIGNMYVDFGYAIMILSIVFVGFLLQTCQIWLVRAKKTVLSIALLSILCISFAKLSQTNFFVTLSTCGVIWSIVTVILLKLLYNIIYCSLRK